MELLSFQELCYMYMFDFMMETLNQYSVEQIRTLEQPLFESE